ncbi:trans-2,3-dihydro-3-hydroxyanthranilate isomerase [Pseudoxanthobacter soli DSM 19599]|uniref:Trans-2,3-dihydro-3-hydroxyanthranilate isomerase n=1 Tax=Pseudoxanthobacter soli DSM 19599 TaxID=1123029 RepID=A0A1M7ZQC9_9HYPH|nr:PhzF family phenazine biosynthesis protein [Pseudoxanthobacter soli]SHO67071.1 trans-2,3-dihydro-3-hydroxyanthranilate isomerase [Pseudoxanthobacter soli DSM 19599]
MPRRFVVLDVFTDQPLTGNGLAVVRDAEGLDDDAMQAIARGFNLSETIFILPPEGAAHTASVRIFTPAKELPFAGHPTVGAAVLLAFDRFGIEAAGQESVVVLEERIGPVRCGVALGADRVGYAAFDVPRVPVEIPFVADNEAIAAALGLLPREIGFENHVPSAFAVGGPFVFVPVAGLEAAARAKPVASDWARAFASEAHSVYLYCRETVRADAGFHARMFAPDLGIGEDPATGSAASAFAGVVHRFDALPDGVREVAIEQGVEMKRPSFIKLEIAVDGGAISGARIGGNAVIVQEGELLL